MNLKSIYDISYSKKELISKAKNDVKSQIDSGFIDPLERYLIAKGAIDYLTEYSNRIHENAFNEFSKHGEKEVNMIGRKISISEFGTSYDYSVCNHPKLKGLEDELVGIKQKIDDIKNTLKSLKESITMVDDETGEVFQLNPPLKTSTTKLKVVY